MDGWKYVSSLFRRQSFGYGCARRWTYTLRRWATPLGFPGNAAPCGTSTAAGPISRRSRPSSLRRTQPSLLFRCMRTPRPPAAVEDAGGSAGRTPRPRPHHRISMSGSSRLRRTCKAWQTKHLRRQTRFWSAFATATAPAGVNGGSTESRRVRVPRGRRCRRRWPNSPSSMFCRLFTGIESGGLCFSRFSRLGQRVRYSCRLPRSRARRTTRGVCTAAQGSPMYCAIFSSKATPAGLRSSEPTWPGPQRHPPQPG